MYFINHIQTYASVNRKGSELQEHILAYRNCLVKDRETLAELRESIRNLIRELDNKYPRTMPLHFDAGTDACSRWHIHAEGRPDSLVCIISVASVRRMIGEGSVSFPGKDNKTGKP